MVFGKFYKKCLTEKKTTKFSGLSSTLAYNLCKQIMLKVPLSHIEKKHAINI